MNKTKKPVILSFIGYSNSGKTGLITQIIPIIKQKGIRVGVIKHANSPIIVDRRGKDSHRHFEAGADPTVVCNDQHLGLFANMEPNTSLGDIANQFFKNTDLLITEGFKKEKYPKIEVYVEKNNTPPICLTDPSILAIVTDLQKDWHIPRFNYKETARLSNWIIETFMNTRMSQY